MGLGPRISSSRYDHCPGCNCNKKPIDYWKEVKTTLNDPRNPDPNNYEIRKYVQSGDNLVVWIRYLNCTNFEGNKILVYTDCTIEQLVRQKTIDPHFSDNTKFYSPFARFEPTPVGWDSALKFLQRLA